MLLLRSKAPSSQICRYVVCNDVLRDRQCLFQNSHNPRAPDKLQSHSYHPSKYFVRVVLREEGLGCGLQGFPSPESNSAGAYPPEIEEPRRTQKRCGTYQYHEDRVEPYYIALVHNEISCSFLDQLERSIETSQIHHNSREHNNSRTESNRFVRPYFTTAALIHEG